MNLYTKNGRPLQVIGDIVYSDKGVLVGRISSSKVYAPSGDYVGTIDGDRLVYRATESAGIGPVFTASSSTGTSRAWSVGSAVWGDEPEIPD